jgi:hypothetical protein
MKHLPDDEQFIEDENGTWHPSKSSCWPGNDGLHENKLLTDHIVLWLFWDKLTEMILVFPVIPQQMPFIARTSIKHG